MHKLLDFASALYNAVPFLPPRGLVVLGKLDCQPLLALVLHPVQHGPGVAQIGHLALGLHHEDCNAAGPRVAVVDSARFQLALRGSEGRLQEALALLVQRQGLNFAVVLLQVGLDVVVRGLRGLFARGSVAVVHGEEVALVGELLHYAVGVLALGLGRG